MKKKVNKKKTPEIVVIKDVTPKHAVVTEDEIPTKPIQSIRSVPSPVFGYQQYGGIVAKPQQRREIFEQPEYDLYEIGRIEDVESYVRQAFKKQVGLFLKEGFDYIGSNKKIVKYIKTRFAQIERATSIAHEELIRRLVSQFIRKSNAFLVKVRLESASGGRKHPDIDGQMKTPIAGYYPISPETMRVKTDGSGKPYEYRQMLPNGMHLQFDPKDIVHFHFDRKEGFLFGTPLIMPVIDDIRALRKIEENIELLIYKHLFPMFQMIVGTEKAPAGITEDGHREIDVAKMELMHMPTEGGIVTPERYEIRAIGAESKALRAESYLQHFKSRVFSGLGMSAVDFGEADTSNRSTADNMSRALVDNIKDLQGSFEAQFNTMIVNELLEEATFPDEVFAPENIVRLEFREVDIDKQIKVENQAADLFAKNGITWDEYRRNLGRDPIPVPDDPETQDRTQWPEWFNTNWKLFHEPEKLINAADESYSSLAMGAANSVSTGVTKSDIQEQQSGQLASDKELAITKEKAKPKPVIRKKDNFLKSDYANMEEFAVEELQKSNVDFNYLRQKLQLLSSNMSKNLRTQMSVAFLSGLGKDNSNDLAKIQSIRNQIHDRADLLIKRLEYDIINTIKHRFDTRAQNVKISTIRAIFNTFKYRIDFITQAEVTRANNLGKITQIVQAGGTKGKYLVQEQTCDQCKTHAITEVNLHEYHLGNVPPHHPNCSCGLQLTEVRGN